MREPSTRDWLTTNEAAMVLGLSGHYMRKACDLGLIACFRIGPCRRIMKRDLLKWATAAGIPVDVLIRERQRNFAPLGA